MLQLDAINHLVLTVADLEATCTFYHCVLGMEVVTFGEGRTALTFGRQKINLHPSGNPFAPHARHPVPGSADLCFLTSVSIDEVTAHLQACDVPVIEGPVRRTGARGPIVSVYIRDPDGNLIEIANEEGAPR